MIKAQDIKNHHSDVLIIGSGLAGLALALKLPKSVRIYLMAKGSLSQTNTSMAQGGIAAVMSKEDSYAQHIQDTLVAGAGLCKLDVVRNFVEQGPERIKDLQNWGVHFDGPRKDQKSGGSGAASKSDAGVRIHQVEELNVDLTREGGHRYRRILHFEDQTGAEIHRSLLTHVQQANNIEIFEDWFSIDLILNKQVAPYKMGPNSCVGVYALNQKTGEVRAFTANQTVLATGGSGKVYLYTTNWAGATGDGIAMAYRAGCRVANLEFTQFHPTCLYHPEAGNFLISEALRGEGGELKTASGVAFMKKYHSMGSLAPRDIVARSIDAEMKKSGDPCVFLDMTHLGSDFLKNRFPIIYNKCLSHGIDMTKMPIPVVPAAHYQCGGVLTDQNGRTDLPGLWALGETACTGFHGANRLASNSLLECLTMAHNSSINIVNELKPLTSELNIVPSPWKRSEEESSADELIVISHMWEEIRRLMWNYVGIVRSDKRLRRARSRLRNILEEVNEYYSNMKVHSDIIELRNIAIVAFLTVECALRRRESRGIHFSLDCPPQMENPKETQVEAKDTLLFKGKSLFI